MLKSVCLLLFNIAFYRNKSRVKLFFFFFVQCYQIKKNAKRKFEGTALKQSCHKLFLSLSLALPLSLSFSPWPEHEIPFQFIEFSSIFFSFLFFFVLKIDFLLAAKLNLYRNCIFFSVLSFICSSFAKCCR